MVYFSNNWSVTEQVRLDSSRAGSVTSQIRSSHAGYVSLQYHGKMTFLKFFLIYTFRGWGGGGASNWEHLPVFRAPRKGEGVSAPVHGRFGEKKISKAKQQIFLSIG